MGFILTFIALFLSFILYPFGILYTFIRLMIGVNIRTWYRYIDRLFYTMALSIDQLGNVSLQHLFNDLLIKKDSIQKFGDVDKTISYVLGANQHFGYLTKLGTHIANILDTIDKDHCKKAFEANS